MAVTRHDIEIFEDRLFDWAAEFEHQYGVPPTHNQFTFFGTHQAQGGLARVYNPQHLVRIVDEVHERWRRMKLMQELAGVSPHAEPVGIFTRGRIEGIRVNFDEFPVDEGRRQRVIMVVPEPNRGQVPSLELVYTAAVTKFLRWMTTRYPHLRNPQVRAKE